MAVYNEFGQEVPDQTPVNIPLKFRAPPTLQEQIRAMVRGELSQVAAQQGHETFEEADDFDVDDDYDPRSPWELDFDQEHAAEPAPAAPAPSPVGAEGGQNQPGAAQSPVGGNPPGPGAGPAPGNQLDLGNRAPPQSQ